MTGHAFDPGSRCCSPSHSNDQQTMFSFLVITLSVLLFTSAAQQQGSYGRPPSGFQLCQQLDYQSLDELDDSSSSAPREPSPLVKFFPLERSVRLDYQPDTAILTLTFTNRSILNPSQVNDSMLVTIELSADWSTDDCRDAGQVFLLSHSLLHVRQSENGTMKYKSAVNLRYVYTGLYRLSLTIGNSNSSMSSSTPLFRPVYFAARTDKTPAPVHNWTTEFLVLPTSSSSIIVGFAPAGPELEFEQYEVFLTRTMSMNSEDGLPDDDSVESWLCPAEPSKPECKFDGLPLGNYTAAVRPLDPRCAYGDIWGVRDHCVIQSDPVELVPEEDGQDVDELLMNNGSVSAAMASMAGFLTALFITAIILVRCRRRIAAAAARAGRRHRLDDYEDELMVEMPSYADYQPASRTEDPRDGKTILILYLSSELDGQQRRLVKQLKGQLAHHCRAKVLDVAEDDLAGSEEWPASFLSEEGDVRFVLIYSPGLLQPTRRPEFTSGTTDGLVFQAIQQLRLNEIDVPAFLVRFSSASKDRSSRTNEEEESGFRSFHLPEHAKQLYLYLNLHQVPSPFSV